MKNKKMTQEDLIKLLETIKRKKEDEIICIASIAYYKKGVFPIYGDSYESNECNIKSYNKKNGDIEFLFTEGYLDTLLKNIHISHEKFIVKIDKSNTTATEIITEKKFPLVLFGNKSNFKMNFSSLEIEKKIMAKNYPIFSFFFLECLPNEHDQIFHFPVVNEEEVKSYLQNNNKENIQKILDQYQECGKTIYQIVKETYGRKACSPIFHENEKLIRKRNAN